MAPRRSSRSAGEKAGRHTAKASRPVTISTIAQASGVSASSVSRVLSGKGYASKQTRERVLDVAHALGYLPNRVAQSLRLQQTKTLGLIVSDVENYFYACIAKEIGTIARGAGYHIVLCNTNDDPLEEHYYLDLLAGLRVDGIIITPTRNNRPKLVDLLERGTPIVQVDRVVDALDCDAVSVNNVEGAYQAVTHLIQAGHSRIGMLAGEIAVSTGHQRLMGYKRALNENGLPFRDEFIQAGSFRRETAVDAVNSLLLAHEHPTAVFAANNILAEVLMFTLGELGLRVPQDVSVVAFDDHLWMRMIGAPLTTIAQPTTEIAREAASLLLQRIDDPSASPAPAAIVLEPSLEVRSSVAPPGPIRRRTEKAEEGSWTTMSSS